MKGLGLEFLTSSSRSSSNKSTPKRTSADDGRESESESVQQEEERIDGVAKDESQARSNLCPAKAHSDMCHTKSACSLISDCCHKSTSDVSLSRSSPTASSASSVYTTKSHERMNESAISINSGGSVSTTTTKPKPLKWLPRPELQSRYIYAAPGRLMMDGRVANLDTIISSSTLLNPQSKSKSKDDWEPQALAEFAQKSPHLAREAGMSLTSLATTCVDEHGNPVEKDVDGTSVGSTIEEEGEGEDDVYGWESEHLSMMSSRDSASFMSPSTGSGQFGDMSSFREMRRGSVDSDAVSERTIKAEDVVRPEEVGISEDMRREMARRPPRDWREQRERDCEGKKRGLLWRVLSMNAR